MTYAPQIREKARELRVTQSLTIDEIADRLAISRTTAFAWTSDLERPKRAISMAGGTGISGNRAMQRKYRRLREQAYELGRWEFPRLIRVPTFRDFVGIYICEGSKRCRNTVAVANSDIAVIRLCDRWIRPMARNPVRYWVQHHADQSLNSLRIYWSSELNIHASQIRFQRKSNSRGMAARTWRSEYGVLTVSAKDTQLRARLQGWIDQLRDDWLQS